MIKILKNIIIGFLLLSIQVSVIAETHIVKMISTDPSDSTVAMAFVPPILKINKGDKVIFEPTQIGHNSASKRGMIPEGAKTWNSKLDEKIEIVYDKYFIILLRTFLYLEAYSNLARMNSATFQLEHN